MKKILVFSLFFNLFFNIYANTFYMKNEIDSTYKQNNIYSITNYSNIDRIFGMRQTELDNLKGRIKQMTQKEFELNDDGIFTRTNSSNNYIYYFNEDFEIFKVETNFIKSKTIINYKSFKKRLYINQTWFDDKNEIICYESFDYFNESDLIKNYIVKKENSEENIILNKTPIDDNTFYYEGLYFNEVYVNNNLIKSKANYNTLVFEYEYFDNYYIRKRFWNNELVNLTKINYNDLELEEIEFENNIEVKKNYYEYNANDNLIKKITDYRDGSKALLLFVYNSNDLLIEEQQEFPESITVKTYTYDRNGNIIKFNNNMKEEIIYEYKYDKNNNWIEKFEKKPGTIKIVREYEYY